MNRKIFLTAAYFACSIPMYYFYNSYVRIAGINFAYYYIAAIVFALITFISFLIEPDIDRMIKVLKYMMILAVPYLVTLLYSFLIWTLNLTPFRVMLRGFFWPVYQLIAICMAACAVYCFGKKGVYYQLTACIAAYILFFLGFIREYGFDAFISQYVELVMSLTNQTGDIMAQIERIAYAHGMGIFLIYLIFTMRTNRKNVWFLIPTLLCFLSGLKRSAMLALAVCALVALLCCFLREKSVRKIFVLSGVLMIALGFCYIWMLSGGKVNELFARFEINSMGREEIYTAIRDFYSFSITYIGKGLGYISYNVGSGLINVGNSSRGDIHNDFLRQYIELGMVGFFVWLYLFFYWRMKKLADKVDVRVGIFALCCLSYCFTCYLTENMYYRYTANLALNVVIMSYALQREEGKNANE